MRATVRVKLLAVAAVLVAGAALARNTSVEPVSFWLAVLAGVCIANSVERVDYR